MADRSVVKESGTNLVELGVPAEAAWPRISPELAACGLDRGLLDRPCVTVTVQSKEIFVDKDRALAALRNEFSSVERQPLVIGNHPLVDPSKNGGRYETLAIDGLPSENRRTDVFPIVMDGVPAVLKLMGCSLKRSYTAALARGDTDDAAFALESALDGIAHDAKIYGLNHPRIPRLLAVVQNEDGTPIGLVTKAVPGVGFLDARDQSRGEFSLSPKEQYRLVNDLLETLEQSGLFIWDPEPRNLLVCDEPGKGLYLVVVDGEALREKLQYYNRDDKLVGLLDPVYAQAKRDFEAAGS